MLCLGGYFWDDEWLLNSVLPLVRKLQPLPVPVMPFRVCCPWPIPLPRPHLPRLHLHYLFLEAWQRDWGQSRKRVAGLYGWLVGPKRQEVLRRNLSSSGLENGQLNGQRVTLAMRRAQMSKRLWEPVLKIQTMVSNIVNVLHLLLYKQVSQRIKVYNFYWSMFNYDNQILKFTRPWSLMRRIMLTKLRWSERKTGMTHLGAQKVPGSNIVARWITFAFKLPGGWWILFFYSQGDAHPSQTGSASQGRCSSRICRNWSCSCCCQAGTASEFGWQRLLVFDICAPWITCSWSITCKR